MLKKESVLFNFTPDTGMKIGKGDIAYSLLSRDYKDNQCIVVLNDQGGKQMDVSYDVTATLRSETHGHLPLILAAGFQGEQSAEARGIGYQDECSPILKTGAVPCVIAFEPGIASRCGGHIYQDKVGTLRSNAGDNQQAVVIGAIDDTYRKQSD